MTQWIYKGHKCRIEFDYEDDNIKARHYVIKPDGEECCADISSYDTRWQVVELWIDAGYPERVSCRPLNAKDMLKIFHEKKIAEDQVEDDN